ncbi:MAG: glycosyl hydrolase [Acidobacteria bacterium]|nr:glycosyl hydrolase [Acidobacteriota bacterium]
MDPSRKCQEVLGFGASLTDSACYMLHQLEAGARESLMRELFHPSGMGLSVGRVPIGSSDYARKTYSYSEDGPDPGLKRFSIDHDREYILPVLREARAMNPGLFLLGSPWSPPAWMKANGSMLGGCIQPRHFAVYAKYFSRFLDAYAAAGVPVNAVTIQNEVDTEQDGRMPSCLWAQEYEMGFVADHLGPLLEREHPGTRIWILDHNYSLWGRAICELDDPRVAKYVDGVAWHGYVGNAASMTRVHDAHPDKHAYWTEGGSDFDDPQYETNWAKWGATFAAILNNWSRCVVGWNLALDEAGMPNIGPFHCGGMVTIDSKTKEIKRSGLYWAMAHHSRAIARGARRLESSTTLDGLAQVAFENLDGTRAVVLTNSAGPRSIVLRISGMEAEVALNGNSVTTLTWR